MKRRDRRLLVGGRRRGLEFFGSGFRGKGFQPHAAPTWRAGGAIANEFDPRLVECLDHLGQAIHDAANVPGTGFHSLNRRHGQAGEFGQGLLVDTEKRARGAELGSGDIVAWSAWDL